MAFAPGNQAARNKGRFAGAIRRHLAQNPEDLRVIVQGLFAAAKGGDIAASRELADRLDGKPKASTEVTGAGGSALFPVTHINVTGVEPAAVVATELARISDTESAE